MPFKHPKKAMAWTALVVAALASPADASPLSGHALVSRDMTTVLGAATDTLDRFAGALFMRVAVALGGPDVVRYARSR